MNKKKTAFDNYFATKCKEKKKKNQTARKKIKNKKKTPHHVKLYLRVLVRLNLFFYSFTTLAHSKLNSGFPPEVPSN